MLLLDLGHDNEQPSVTVRGLDWNDCDVEDADVILAADCVYDPGDAVVLASALNRMMRPGSSAIIVSAVRNPATHAVFEATLQSIPALTYTKFIVCSENSSDGHSIVLQHSIFGELDMVEFLSTRPPFAIEVVTKIQ